VSETKTKRCALHGKALTAICWSCADPANLRAEIDRLRADNERQAKENTTLRGVLATSALPCIYCGLDDISMCASGFPGCGRMDDIMSVPEPAP